MESIVGCSVDLFGEELPSLEVIGKLSAFVHSGEKPMLDLGEQVDSNMGRTSGRAVLAVGIGLYILGRDAEAVSKLEKGDDCKEKYLYLAYALRRVRRFEEAIENLDKSLAHDANSLNVSLDKAETYRLAGNFEAASEELKGCGNFDHVSADYHYQCGLVAESQGLYEESIEQYTTALELSPNHAKAIFRLAYRYDMSGDEETAIDYYKQLVSHIPVHVNALLNLAVLYEDCGDYDMASQCIDKVLEHHPNHKRAILFSRDVESSKTMYYDEEKEKSKDRHARILETPISDFELSVRSRNCFRKMNIFSLGDLMNITESELLSYKNFGETSLREIKAILEAKGLHLGASVLDTLGMSGEGGAEGESDEGEEQETGMLQKPVDELRLSVRAQKCLEKLELRTLGELVIKTEAELLGVKNFGVTSLIEIRQALEDIGLSLRSLD